MFQLNVSLSFYENEGFEPILRYSLTSWDRDFSMVVDKAPSYSLKRGTELFKRCDFQFDLNMVEAIFLSSITEVIILNSA